MKTPPFPLAAAAPTLKKEKYDLVIAKARLAAFQKKNRATKKKTFGQLLCHLSRAIPLQIHLTTGWSHLQRG